MRISATRMGPAVAAARRRGGGGFVVPEAADTEPSSACAPAAPACPAGTILTVDDASGADRAVADRQARQHGAALLEGLRRLQLDQLGGDPGASLAGLAALSARHAEAADSGLREVVQAIAARAAVELARRR